MRAAAPPCRRPLARPAPGAARRAPRAARATPPPPADDPSPQPPPLSADDAAALLGVDAGADFDAVLAGLAACARV
jgi:hypothetical protein